MAEEAQSAALREVQEKLGVLLMLEDDEMTEWEINFVEDLSHLGDNLSEKQIVKIHDIYDRIFP